MEFALHEYNVPALAILTVDDGAGLFKGNQENFIDLIRTGQQHGLLVYVLTAKEFSLAVPYLSGFQYNFLNNKWYRTSVPAPKVVYNRVPYRSQEQLAEVQQAIQACMKSRSVKLFNPCFFNKWTLFEWLNKSKETKKYIPSTHKLTDAETLGTLLESYSSVYLKPSKGKAGKGIMKLERRSGKHKKREFRLSIQDGKQSHISSYPDIHSVWNRIKLLQINTEDYIVQQGIDLASYKQRPYDLRVLMQKNSTGSWSLSGIGARVAGKLSITTHVPRGGMIDDPGKLLTSSFGVSDARRVLSRTKQAALLIAKQVEESCGSTLGEMSMDLGVDRNGQIWFFEANSKPMKFDEPDIRKTSLEQIIRYSLFLCRPKRKKTAVKTSAERKRR